MDSHGVKKTFEVVKEEQVIDGKSTQSVSAGFRFGRMFDGVPPFRPTILSLTMLGGSMTNDPPGDSAVPAGYTYFGQFVDHDITKDGSNGDPVLAADLSGTFTEDEIKQERSPSLDLDSLYGETEADAPRPDGMRFKLGDTFAPPTPNAAFPGLAAKSHPGFDLPRAPSGKAMIGDPRNDENLIVAQFHLAMLKFHNKVVDHVLSKSPTDTPPVAFAKARELVTRHYQWIVLNDFVRRIVDAATYKDVLGAADLDGKKQTTLNPKVFKVSAAQTPPMPLEFSAAAYRLGHSMVRQFYSWNIVFRDGGLTGGPPGFGFFFQFTHKSGGIGRRSDPTNPDEDFGPSGGLPAFPSNWIADWRRMFPLDTVKGFPKFKRGDKDASGEVPLNMAKLIDTHLAPELGRLPVPVKPTGTPPSRNLAVLNLIRGSRNGLPSGQDAVATINARGGLSLKALTPAQLAQGLTGDTLAKFNDFEFGVKTPLWYYILKEAEVVSEGATLGPAGSRIVLETFVALIRASMTSIFNADPVKPGVVNIFSPADSPLRTPGGEPLTTLSHLLAFVGDTHPLG
jgi:hypothetical protein